MARTTILQNALIPLEGMNLIFYLDSVNGNDSFDGKTLPTAFKTIERLFDSLYEYRFLTKDAQLEYRTEIYFADGTYPGSFDVVYPLPQGANIELRSISGDPTTCFINNLNIKGDDTNRIDIRGITINNRLRIFGSGFFMNVCNFRFIQFWDGANGTVQFFGINAFDAVSTPVEIYNYCNVSFTNNFTHLDSFDYTNGLIYARNNNYVVWTPTPYLGNSFTGATIPIIAEKDCTIEEINPIPGAGTSQVDSTSFLNDIPGFVKGIYIDDAAAGVGGLVTGEIYQTAAGDLKVKL